jgi:hypothetical protein
MKARFLRYVIVMFNRADGIIDTAAIQWLASILFSTFLFP